MHLNLRLVAPIPLGHRVEVTTFDSDEQDATPYGVVTDLDSGVIYRSLEPFIRGVDRPGSPLSRPRMKEEPKDGLIASLPVRGRVLECMVQTGIFGGVLIVQTNLHIKLVEGEATYR